MNKRMLAVVTVLFLVGCQSPPSMFGQRSEFRLERIGNLVVSTSPRFSRLEFQATDNELLIEEAWVIQNVNTQKEEVLLEKAVAQVKDRSFPITCKENESPVKVMQVLPGEKAILRCTWRLAKNPPSQNDMWVTFSVPTVQGSSITSHKIIRVEDFE